MYYFDNTKAAAAEMSDVTISLWQPQPVASGGEICVAPMPLKDGLCFFVRAIADAKFSFTAKSESIMKTLCLTVTNICKLCHRNVSRTFKTIAERAKNAVRTCAPRFLRL